MTLRLLPFATFAGLICIDCPPASGIHGVYFSQREYHVEVPDDVTVDTAIGRVFVHNGIGQLYPIMCSLDDVISFQDDVPEEFPPYFAVNATSHEVYIAKGFQRTRGEKAEYRLRILCDNFKTEESAAVHFHVHVTSSSESSWQMAYCDKCLYFVPQQIYVQENTDSLIAAQFIANPGIGECEHHYTLEARGVQSSEYYDSRVALDETSLELHLTGPFDHEIDRQVRLNITCYVTADGATRFYVRTLDLHVGDVDDNGPVIIQQLLNGKQDELKSASRTFPLTPPSESRTFVGSPLSTFTVHDLDNEADNIYEAFLFGDERHLFNVILRGQGNGTKYRSVTADVIFAQEPDMSGEYSIQLIFNDTSLVIIEDDTRPPEESTVTFNITTIVINGDSTTEYEEDADLSLPPQNDILTDREGGLGIFSKQSGPQDMDAVVHINSAMYTRIITISQNTETHNVPVEHTFQEGSSHSDVFGITPTEGIIFVRKPLELQKLPKRVLSLAVRRESNRSIDSQIVVVTLSISGQPSTQRTRCDFGCSGSPTAQICVSSCGYGAMNGRCVWLSRDQSNDHVTSEYNTCTADETTCPDLVCDELEQMVPQLCPQDCARNASGDFHIGTKNGVERGLIAGRSPCVCPSADHCHCGDISELPDWLFRIPTDNRLPGNLLTSTGKGSQEEPHLKPDKRSQEGPHGPEFSPAADPNVCNQQCRFILMAIVGGMSIVSITLCLALRRHRNCKSRSDSFKQASSIMSLSALTSDYTDDLERSGRSSMDWSPRFLGITLPLDRKWEFPRQKLVLDKTLGEGEFGRVVKARAQNMFGNRGYTTVAVKMLKGNATGSEFRDLWSEFNLLKDVSHQNVIRLLGACTQKGPFYLIVEYCEHGSLRSFLRNYRQKESLYSDVRFVSGWNENEANAPNKEDPPDEVITPSDLLSFSWQVAKGMEYLANRKFVHRDLAARNILVAWDKVIKISDFGMSRDVYEEDTYLKKSKGRIPVKWIAPESLYENTYTAKSDVWSYGIVLWEITTLGATPYPGIAPERLYQILKTGYRMEKPTNCSDEMYGVMAMCWHLSPSERPSFTQLADIFEGFLTRNVEYLDLSGIGDKSLDFDDEDCDQDLAYASEDEDGYGNISRLSMDHNCYVTPTAHSQAAIPEISFCDECTLRVNRENTDNITENTRLLETYIASLQAEHPISKSDILDKRNFSDSALLGTRPQLRQCSHV